MIEKLPHRHLNVTKDRPKKSGANGFTGVNRHDSSTSVWMFEKYVAATSAEHREADAF
jgi:hypothetical protein